jgi:prepilin-type N-terminal cleavage/methylation domain-containing protein
VPTRRRAYTLLELLLVIAILALIASITIPSLDVLYGSFKTQAAADSVRGAWATARSRAMEESRAYRFAVVPGRGNFRIAPDDDSFWTGGDPPDDPENPSLIREDALPDKVHFDLAGGGSGPSPASGPDDSPLAVGSVDPGQWVTVAVFQPDGTALQDLEITFRCDGARPITLQLRALTGLTTVKPDDSGDRP